MARTPIGTVTDEERLVPLVTGDDGFHVDVTEPVGTAGLPERGTYAWRLRDRPDVPRLALAPVEDADEAGALPTRVLTAADDALTLAVPEPLLAEGLGLDTAAYDDDTPLLFEPRELDDDVAVGMEPGGEPAGVADVALELVPVRYADGTPYRREPVDGADLDSDPVAEGELARRPGEDGTPRSETISAPVDAPIVEDVVVATGVPRDAVVGALETIARNDLVAEEDDEATGEPLAVDDRVLIALDDDAWDEDVAAELDADDAVLAAVREIHARQADELLAGDEEGRERFEGHTPVVVHRSREYERGSDPPWKPG